MRDRGSASGGHDAPLGLGQLGEALADAVHQLIQMNVVAGSLVHGALHFRKRLRARDNGERSPAIDDWPDANRFIDVRADLESACGVGGGSGLRATARQKPEGGKESALAEKFSAGRIFVRHRFQPL